MIEIRSLTKRYGATIAVDDITATIAPGKVTGFLGPNGAGKSTTLRTIVGLVHPTSGSTSVAGVPYVEMRHPLRTVGALLDARGVHPSRTARHHLEAIAATNRISRARVEETLGLVGLADRADEAAGGYSLGMGQRLGIAAALLGDPEILILDEPVNGLDTDGIRWIRGLLRNMAAEGRTVLLSSHLMAEVELTVDHLVVIGRGRLLADAPVADVLRGAGGGAVRVATPVAELADVLAGAGAIVTADRAGSWRVEGLTAARVGELAAGHGMALHHLEPIRTSLEEAYLAMTTDADADHAQESRS